MVVSTDVTIRDIQAQGKTAAKDAAVELSPSAYQAVPPGALFAQQGDIYLKKLADIPEGAQPISPRLQLVPGVSMGSRHCLDSLAGIQMFTVATPTPLDGPVLVLSQERAITHPKHGDLCGLPAGAVIQIIYQRAYATEVRRVVD